MKVNINVLRSVAEDVESAVDELRGLADIAEFRAVLDLKDEGVRLVVTLGSSHADPEIEILPLPEKDEKKATA